MRLQKINFPRGKKDGEEVEKVKRQKTLDKISLGVTELKEQVTSAYSFKKALIISTHRGN